MAPRGRPRKLQVGLGRMDTAIDAMGPLGFSKEVVKRKVNQLLQVYEGDAGWVFIEEASYKLLLESILEDQEKSDEEKGPMKDGYSRDEDDAQPSLVGPSIEVPNDADPSAAGLIGGVCDVAVSSSACPASGVLEAICSKPEVMSNSLQTNEKEGIYCLPSVERAGSGWRDIVLDKHMHDNTGNSSVANNRIHSPAKHNPSPSQDPMMNLPKQRRKCCNGWISDDDEEEEIELLNLTPTILLPFDYMVDGAEKRGRRKSRWDVRPEDL